MKEKNPNGEGSLRQRKDGRWEFRVKVEGRTTPLSFYSKDKDGRGAKKKYRDWLRESGGEAVESVKTVEKWARTWLEVSKKGRVAPKTYENYEYYIEIFCENWQKPVKQRITPHLLTTSPSNYYEFTTKE